MKIIRILTVMLLFAFGAQVQAKAVEPQAIVQGPVDSQIKKLVSAMIKKYNLTNDQQIAVKEAASKMAADAAAQKPIDVNERTMLRDAFSVTMSNKLTQAQYTQYRNDLTSTINPLLDEIINTASK